MVRLPALGIELALPSRIRYHDLGKVESLGMEDMEISEKHGNTTRVLALAHVLGPGLNLSKDGECFGPLHNREDPRVKEFYVGIENKLGAVKSCYVLGREETTFLQKARLLGTLRSRLEEDHFDGTGLLTFMDIMVRTGLGSAYTDRIAAIGGVYAAMRAGYSVEELTREAGRIHLGPKTKERIMRQRIIGSGVIFEETEVARGKREYRAMGYDSY